MLTAVTLTVDLSPLGYEPDVGFEHMVGFLVVDSFTGENPVSVVCWAGELANPESDPLVLVDLGPDPTALIAPDTVRPNNRFILWRDTFWRCPEWDQLYDLSNPPDLGQFSKFALPLMKRAYPPLIASQLVSVQPMSQPAGLLFYLRYKYAKTKREKDGQLTASLPTTTGAV